jgi:CBS domain-containing protein
MLKVSEILRVKGDTLYTTSPDMSIQKAIETMSSMDIGSLVVMEHGELVGMITFREIIKHVHQNQGQTGNYTVRHIMDDAPVSVSPNTSFEEVQRLMLEKHARYMPVMDGPTLMGVVSFYDMAKAIVAAQEFENKMLKAYIRDWPSDHESAA